MTVDHHTAPAPPTAAKHIFDAGGTDPDFYFPPKRASAGSAGFFRFVRTLPGRLARTLRG
ncbi:hypothetical protein ACFQ36_09540 [Arthrobacter sp. GCM10027362]|uniref:hypothetical protein n=1 Tax=Arthrobacter sp. GCM10027362 TaxID=3273379 RepID=UPI00363FCEF4